jgi:DNA polymerase-3 subunit beta
MSQINPKQDLEKTKKNQEIDLIFKTKSLQKALNVFQTILEKKSLIPIFSNLKMSVKKNRVCFSGMNIDLAAIHDLEILNLLIDSDCDDETVAAPAAEPEESCLLLNGHLFADVIKKISSDEIAIKKNFSNNFIEIFAGDFFCKMSLQENEKFPSIDTLENKAEYGILAEILESSIESVLSCSAINDSRAFLCAIKIVQNLDNSVEFIATDGHKMAYLKWNEKKFEINEKKRVRSNQISEKEEETEENQEAINLILPRKTALFILKFLKETHGQKIFLKISGQKIIFLFSDPKDQSSKIKIISKISNGNYPNYKKLLNFKYKFRFSLPLKKILDGIDRALIFLDEKNSKVLNFELGIKSKKITLITQSDDKGMVREIIDEIKFLENNNESDSGPEKIETIEKIILNINAYYLYEILKSIKNENVIFGFNDSQSPIAVSDKNFEEKFYLLMPMIS